MTKTEKQRLYRHTPSGKKAVARYNSSPKSRAAQKRYWEKPGIAEARREIVRKYRDTIKGLLANARAKITYNAKRRGS